MQKNYFSFINNEKGSAIIIVALGMVIFLGLVSLVTDAGLIFVSKSKLINAIDASALAGAQELPEHPNSAVSIAKNYAVANGVNIDDLSIEVINSNKAIKVQAERTVNLLFAKVLGINTGFVEHQAVAQVGPIAATDGVVPLGIQKQELIFGEQYSLKVGAGESDTGWFGALALGGPGASTYEENLTNGYQETINIGDIFNIETGNMSNPTTRAVNFRMAECKHSPYCTVDSFDRDCPRLVKLPIIEVIDSKVKVVGFGVLLLDDVLGQGTDCYVKGKFVQTILPGEINGEAENFGVLGVKLIQ